MEDYNTLAPQVEDTMSKLRYYMTAEQECSNEATDLLQDLKNAWLSFHLPTIKARLIKSTQALSRFNDEQ